MLGELRELPTRGAEGAEHRGWGLPANSRREQGSASPSSTQETQNPNKQELEKVNEFGGVH